MTEDSRMTQSRRALLTSAGVACAALLAGCTTYDANNGGLAGPPPSSGAPATSASGVSVPDDGVSSGGASSAAAPVPGALTTTAQVPEGGGTIINGSNIVITQPAAGTFKGFSAVCTHAGCIVNSVSDGTINCPCHGSKFSIKDGSVVHGPALSPLAGVNIKLEGTSIVKA
jgi:nitrite reductase/ring-hydroxylating ferredoxin subunit